MRNSRFMQPQISAYLTTNPRGGRKLALIVVVAMTLAATLSGCSKKDRDLQSGAEELFERGNKSMSSGNYRNAIGYYEGLSARYPFSNQAKQAQLDLIFCYYKNGEQEAAIDAATQFERENPTHPRVDYAIYMQGLANFRGQQNAAQRLFRLDMSKRPPVQAQESFSAFSRLVQRYPDSPYAADARQRMVFLRNRLAEHENHVANYYFRRGAYVAALNRAKFSIETFDGAPAVADSMFIMVESYKKLGMQDLAEATTKVLETNYPEALKPEPLKKRFYFF
jgi:outer membrane protein assembly factor BamD